MDVILRVPTSEPLNRIADFVAEAEAAGFFGVAFPDTQLTGRDTYLTLALAAQRTTKIHLYSMVSNPVTRHVTVMASTMQTIDEIAPGRLHITLGTGAGSVTSIGQSPAKVGAIKDMILKLKQLLAGETASFNGSQARLNFSSPGPMPILVAGRGPRVLGMAGEVADGSVPYVGLHPHTLACARERLGAGASKAGRSPLDMEEVLDVHLGLAATEEEAQDLARPASAYWASQPTLASLLAMGGVEVPKGLEAADWTAAQGLAPSLSSELVANISQIIGAYGTPEQVTGKLAKAAGWGVRRIYVRPSEGNALPLQTLKAFQEVIFPALNNLGIGS